jgi:transcriptional regulator with XRE-family HTH domain
MDQVAERLAELRERRALTLRELGEISGVAADTINQIELGHRKARPSTLRKLARALEIDVQEFYAEPALGKGEAPRGAGHSRVERLEILGALAESAEAVASRIQARLERAGDASGETLVALFQDTFFAMMGAQLLQAQVNDEAEERAERTAEKRARSRIERAATRLEHLFDEMAAGLELEGTEEAEVVQLFRHQRHVG